jgi:hypothetical protein
LNISSNIPNPVAGNTVTFTCGQVAGAARYEFRVRLPDGNTTSILPVSTNSNVSQPYNITSSGAYKVQCRICTGAGANTCQAYESL